jgi:hypothetical protein
MRFLCTTLLLLAAGCGARPNPYSCGCGSGEVCYDGVCRRLCDHDADCGSGEACDEGVCLETMNTCTTAADCTHPGPCERGADAACTDGACVYERLAAGDPCDDGRACTTGDACDGAGVCSGTVACNDLPEASCSADDSTFTTWSGVCDPGTGECDYVDSSSSCPSCAASCLATCIGPGCPTGVNGMTCSGPADCDSGNCVDGRCCNTACGGNCDRCDLPGHLGTCTPDDTACTGNCGTCNAATGNCGADESLCPSACSTCQGYGAYFACSACEPLRNGQTGCASDNDCESRHCDLSPAGEVGRCCIAPGTKPGLSGECCDTDSDCASGFCSFNACSTGDLGSYCENAAKCTGSKSCCCTASACFGPYPPDAFTCALTCTEHP